MRPGDEMTATFGRGSPLSEDPRPFPVLRAVLLVALTVALAGCPRAAAPPPPPQTELEPALATRLAGLQTPDSAPIRAAVGLADDPEQFLAAILTGGRMDGLPDGVPAEDPPWLVNAELRLVWGSDGALQVGEPEPPSGCSPFRLRTGRFAGEENLLVLVYAAAPFDAVMRRRPWIYRVVENDDGLPHLEPRWRGTSFARPFRDATFGDFTGEGEGEIAALEVGRDGNRLLTAYRFEGFGLEGLAPSLPMPRVEERLEAVARTAAGRDEALLRALDGRFVCYSLEGDALQETLSIAGPPEVLEWSVTDAAEDAPARIECVLPDGTRWAQALQAAEASP
jgi:hypothetical protein